MIAVLIGGTDPFERTGGHESYVLAHAEAAVRAGFDTHVFYVSASGAQPAVAPPWTAHPVRTPVWPRRTMTAAAHAPFLAPAVDRFIDGAHDGLIVHAFSTWAYVVRHVARRASARGRRVSVLATMYTTGAHEANAKLRGIVRAHHGASAWGAAAIEYGWSRAVTARSERRALRAMSAVLVNYRSVEALLRSDYALDVPIRLAPYAPLTAFRDDAVQRAAPRAASEPPLIVAVSRQDPRKGVDRLLRALALLRADGVAFRACLVGGGPLLAAHRALCDRLGLAGCVTLPGRVDDAYAYLRDADVFALPSLEEASGSVSLLEAMQAACAVVSTDVDGLPEDVAHDVNGLLVPPDDAVAMRDALGRLIGDASLRARLGTAARATFEARFSADVLVAYLRKLYGEVVRGG